MSKQETCEIETETSWTPTSEAPTDTPNFEPNPGPDANARRFQNSAKRLAMPALPEELFLQAVRELVKLDREWIPSTQGSSLYLRPFMIATEVVLGVKPSAEYLFCVIACPVGAYFKGGASAAVTIWVSDSYTRAAPGGTGEAKCAAPLSNTYGTIAMSTSMTTTDAYPGGVTWNATAELFINLGDNAQLLDPLLFVPVCVVGPEEMHATVERFPSFGELSDLGGPGPSLGLLYERGNAYIRANASWDTMAITSRVETVPPPTGARAAASS